MTAKKIRDAQNIDFNLMEQNETEIPKNSVVRESSLLGQLLAPCLTTYGDPKDEDEKPEDNNIEAEAPPNAAEQTSSIRVFLSSLLELINIKKSLVRLSIKFPILYMNRKEYEELKKKTSEYNISI